MINRQTGRQAGKQDMAVIDLAGVSQQTMTGNWVLNAISYTINL